MGQGYSITTLSAGSAGIDVPEMVDLTYEKSLGNARFMKTIRARHKDGLVVVKIVMKPYSSFKLDDYMKVLIEERKKLLDIPNTLGYHRILESATNGYLVRQYIHGSLYDRMSTRPFLDEIEKTWIAFQLISAVRDCHAAGIHHGDIKTENVLVTSWNWVYLSDFSSAYKPTYLPEDNPADFSFFFDTSGRRTCYLAPERFLSSGDDIAKKPDINWAMDIFSLGCVLAELFLEAPIFNLSQLFKYRSNKEYNPEISHLSRIANKDVRDMITHMICLDPQARYSADEYLDFWKVKVFPEYFYNFLHQYMHLITDPSSGRNSLTSGKVNLGESDDRIDRLYHDFDKISYFLKYEQVQIPAKRARTSSKSSNQLIPLQIDLAGTRHTASSAIRRPSDDGTLLFLSIVVGCLKSTARTDARLKACDLMLAFAEKLTDEAKLDRILPFLMSLLHDESDHVKIAALQTITQILALVTAVSPTNSYIFPEYLLPRFQHIVFASDKQASAWVRSTYASCLGSLATIAGHFLDMNQAINSKGALPTSDPEAEEGTISRSTYQNMFEAAREDIISQFELHTKALLTDSDASVRRSLLPSIGTLCVFFGTQRASDVVLSHLNTYLNDRDWQLKSAFFETIVGVATYVGTAGLEEFILPLMVQALTDPEEAVVERVLRSFSSIAELGLFQRPTLWELLDIVIRFTMHPNLWIREAAAQFVTATTKFATLADQYGIVIPMIRPYLTVVPKDLSELAILDALKKPLSRIVLELSVTWAKKNEKTLFWKNFHKQRVFSFAFGDNMQVIRGKTSKMMVIPKSYRSTEDDKWLERLRNAGLSLDDESKLLALQEYIWRSAQRGIEDDTSIKDGKFNAIVKMSDLEVELQNVFFDNDQALMQVAALDVERKTMAEAMLEATSSSIRTADHTTRRTSNSLTTPVGIPGRAVQSPTSLVPDSNPQVSSSFDSRRSLRVTEHSPQVKGNPVNLIGRRDVGKVSAEISTDTTNAIGQVERNFSQDSRSRKAAVLNTTASSRTAPINVGGRKIAPVHTYPGNDPSILHLLDSLYLEHYPVDMIEFGPLVTPVRGEPLKRSGSNKGTWRPDGTLVAMLCEHTAAINRIAVAPDHKFFITGSDDGTVKVWDVGRLERNVTHRSRHTHQQGAKAKITSLCFVENTHCFVSTGSDGSVNVVRVECIEQLNSNMTRYGRMTILREYQLAQEEHAVWSQHLKFENQSILILATNKARVYGIEMRTMTIIYTFQNPLHHGALTCFCVDRKNQWILLGTSLGILDLWDLRFRMRLRSWGFPGGTPIHKLDNSIFRGSKRWKVVICGGVAGEIMLFDVEKAQIQGLYKTTLSVSRETSSRIGPATPTLLDLDEDSNRPGGILSRFISSSPMETAAADSDKGVVAVVLGTHGDPNSSDARNPFLVSAGPDWRIRFWDHNHPERSVVVSGLGHDDVFPTYMSQDSYGIKIMSEILGTTGDRSAKQSGTDTSASTPFKRNRNTRSTVVSMQQQSLLKGHKDMITDIAMLDVPYGMIVSVDRAGLVYVFS